MYYILKTQFYMIMDEHDDEICYGYYISLAEAKKQLGYLLRFHSTK